MAPCPHIIVHMDMDMAPCLHIIVHVDMDMAPCPNIFTLNLLSLTSRHRSGYGSMFAYYHSHGALLHCVISVQNLFTFNI